MQVYISFLIWRPITNHKLSLLTLQAALRIVYPPRRNPLVLHSLCLWYPPLFFPACHLRWAVFGLAPRSRSCSQSHRQCAQGTTRRLGPVYSPSAIHGNSTLQLYGNIKIVNTYCVSFVEAAVPQTPFPNLMVWQATFPWKGPRINWLLLDGSST